MKIAITGSTGLVGSALVPLLKKTGHDVVCLSRPSQWDPEKGTLDLRTLDGIDAFIHLAGENIAGRWTAEKKARIRDSRVKGTRALCEALSRLEKPPKVMVCASATGYYGDRGDEVLRESSPPVSGFLS